MTSDQTPRRQASDNLKVLRTGFTTGTCAAAAAKAAVMLLTGKIIGDSVSIRLPGDDIVTLPVEHVLLTPAHAEASVRKNAGDDPDVTDGALITAVVSRSHSAGVEIAAGKGVGTVTKPGLAIPPGEPAINPVPREMIRTAVSDVTDDGIRVTISIPAGEELADKTFNPRLGIVGGLSVLGTSGVVRPFSAPALRDSLKCSLSVAAACGIRHPILVPGRIGLKAARRLFRPRDEQIIEVSNEWGFMLDLAAEEPFTALLVLGHPGKLAKLPAGWWDTHSSRSESAVPYVEKTADEISVPVSSESHTVESVFLHLSPGDRKKLGDRLAQDISQAVTQRISNRFRIATVIVDLQGNELGRHGDTTWWEPSLSK
jgi:cobalt-precorrin-5B (C1)-methyltransferase